MPGRGGWFVGVVVLVSALAACELTPPESPDLAVVLDLASPDRASPGPPGDGGLDGSPPDLTEPPAVHGTHCGESTCALEANLYCHTSDWGASGVCVMRPSASPGYYGCDGPEDCATGACCRLGAASACSALGFCVSGTTVGEFMCHRDAECGQLSRCCPLGPEVPGTYRSCVDGLSAQDPCPVK